MVDASLALLLVFFGLLILFLGLARRQRRLNPRLPKSPVRPTPAAKLERLQISRDYWGVKIQSHCPASAHLVGHCYEFDTVPTLPAPGCKAAICECGYIGLPERRKGGDRRNRNERRSIIREDMQDRRSQRPRRKADLAAWAAQGNF